MFSFSFSERCIYVEKIEKIEMELYNENQMHAEQEKGKSEREREKKKIREKTTIEKFVGKSAI